MRGPGRQWVYGDFTPGEAMPPSARGRSYAAFLRKSAGTAVGERLFPGPCSAGCAAGAAGGGGSDGLVKIPPAEVSQSLGNWRRAERGPRVPRLFARLPGGAGPAPPPPAPAPPPRL